MSIAESFSKVLTHAGRAVILMFLTCTALLLAMISSPPAQAVGENFCSNAWLQPFGQPGDRCTAPQGAYIYGVNLVTNERAGCASIQNNGVVLDSWKCTSSYNVLATYYIPNNRWAHGIIRNNNLSYGGYFSASQSY